MKNTRSLLVGFGLLSGVAFLPLTSHAQAPAPSPTPSVSTPPAADAGTTAEGEHHGRQAEKWDALTSDERARLKAAHEKAAADPAVKAAEAEKSTNRRAYRRAMHNAMLRADPTIGLILEKLHPAGRGHNKAAADE